MNRWELGINVSDFSLVEGITFDTNFMSSELTQEDGKKVLGFGKSSLVCGTFFGKFTYIKIKGEA